MKDDRLYLRHILDAIGAIEEFLQDTNQREFMENRMQQSAVIRELAVIGEAAAKISDDFRTTHSIMPFKKMIGLRNRLIHAYIDVDLDIVWETSTRDLGILEDEIEKLLGE